ncbi:AraC family transcriptional regulator [Granulicella mallensis]|uniref:AraC-like DNA-binding protein n=1 Tax=Granulicella mallensis TaxID=940614 RepID=A0A7W8E8L7_9BACT|nr:AraC family transcriptional regulator [Granulicella mallensis]MBB5062674.1 AraC-like DNA-binding protein [Granulicella mallensis]
MTKYFRVTGMLRPRLEELEIPVPAVLRRAGLPHNFFEQTRILVSTEQLFALWDAIGFVSNDPAVGVKLSSESRIERFDPIALSTLTNENFFAAVRHIARYKSLCAPEEIIHQEEGNEWSIQFRWTLALDTDPQVFLEACFAWMLNIARHGTGTRISPLRLEFVQPRSHVRELERHFGCPVHCNAPRNALIFRASDALIPFITRNAELLDALAPEFEQSLKLNKEDNSFIELVGNAIRSRLTGRRPVIEEIARDLHVSSRTMQRRLKEAGSSFQGVLDQARHQMARYYLKNSVLELNEAAYLLGYEDGNSFVRAFRIWEGVPPGLWREENRA